MTASLNISRRTFIKASALVVGGLVIAFSIPEAKRFLFQKVKDDAAAGKNKLPEPNAFLRIDTDNTITVMLAHSEMGQSIWTTLPMLIAEELDADWSKIKVEHAKAAPVYAHTAYGLQITGGSTTTWSEFHRYRQVGALTRALLVTAAAEEFGVAADTLRTENGFVISGDKKISYGELVERAATLDTPHEVTLKQPQDWKVIGKATKRLDGPEKINGTAVFGQDIYFDDLKIAMVARSPVFGGKLKSYDATAAKQVKGVVNVVQVPSGVAVIADHYWAAKQGREALKIDWDLGAGANLDTTVMLAQYRELAAKPGVTAAKAGDVRTAKSAKLVEAEYVLPFLAHSPMEPLNCTVKISDDACEIWTGTQMQTTDQQAAAKILGIKPEQVNIHTVFLGGGFGRRANPAADFVSEAVHVAKAAGVTVKTVWSREDDIRGGYYRPMFLHKAKIGLTEDGIPNSWEHVEVGQSIMTGTTPFEAFMIKDGVDATSVEGVADSPYMKSVANHWVSLHTPKSPIPVLWWRSVGHSHSAFVMESLMDELAHAAGKDPLDYRRALLKDHPRHLAALNLAAEKAGWGQPLAKGISRGIAVHESFGSYVAHVAEVSVSKEGTVKVHRVVCAVDCGLAVNPDSLVAQMESSIAFALSAALQSKITFKDGMVEQSNFHDYNVMRMADMPKVEVHIVPSTEKMGGAGEPGVPPLAPAVTNAVFAATGKRIRSLPIADQLA